ncbi:MAG: response regulator transcription factor [Lachnospiraceae bacterium]|nr:response regulator transcription factor [Lachnospiraceae bacterium]
MSTNIVVFNNNTGIVKLMKPLFAGEGIQVLVAESFEQLNSLLRRELVQLILTDIVFEHKDIWDGLEYIKQIRGISNIPLIVVSDKRDEDSKILALNAGADDYCSTECSPLELLARVKSQLRRYLALVKMCDNIEHIYKVDELEIDDNTRKVTVGNREVRLTPIEYKILRLLVMEKGKVLSIEQIYRAIWEMQPVGADNTIAVHIRHIREKIEENPKEPRYLKVVWGTGYKVG